MKERPILMSAPMVRAILAGTKTQTRLVVKRQPVSVEYWLHGERSDRLNGLPTMRDENGHGWAMCGPFKCPYINEESFAGMGGRLFNADKDNTEAHHSRLWVKETHRVDQDGPLKCGVQYRADLSTIWGADSAAVREWKDQWRPSIFMPRWASRITLEIVSVRVERLKSISHLDCIAEGLPDGTHRQRAYWDLWDSINGKGTSDANPWVWVIAFSRLPDVKEGAR